MSLFPSLMVDSDFLILNQRANQFQNCELFLVDYKGSATPTIDELLQADEFQRGKCITRAIIYSDSFNK
jgi:hypothetical protein